MQYVIILVIMGSAVAFAYRYEVPGNNQSGNNLPGRPELFAMLRQRDLLPVVTQHAEQAFTDAGVEAVTLIGPDERTLDLGYIALDTLGVIVNRLDRSIKRDTLPEPGLLPPMINENATRSLAFRKIRAHLEVLGPLGLDMPTALITSEDDVDAFTDEHDAAFMIIKPNSGTNSKGILRVARGNLKTLLGEQPDLIDSHIIQPAYDFTQPFPSVLRPYDAASREAFDGWNTSDQVKELRMYGFHSPAGTEVFPAARAFKDGDQWFFVDPESLPARVVEGTRQAIAKAAGVSGALALYGTVDFGYGSTGDQPPDWYAVEFNGRMPYMIGYDKHPGVANILREHFANQIHATTVQT